MSKRNTPVHHPSNDPLHRRGVNMTSSDPPYAAEEALIVQQAYGQQELAPSFGRRLARIGQDIYVLGQYPWVFVFVTLSYFAVSVVWLIEKASAVNVLSFIVSLFALSYAVAHNLVQLIECLSVILRQVGFAFKFLGRTFTATGQLFRRTAKRLRDTHGGVRPVR